VLRERVTSPGGTTAAALALLMDPSGLQPLITAAVTAATERSRELAGDAGRPPDTGSARR
jgi:pyrroline-5-carboxylate reductase